MHKKFNAPFIFWTEVPNHKEIKEEILPEIKELYSKDKDRYVPTWNSYVYTSLKYENSFLRKEHILESIVWKPLDQMFSEVDLTASPEESSLIDIWWNYYPKGGFQEAHTHENTSSTFSGAYLLDVNEINSTVFTDFSPMFYLQKEHHTRDIVEGSVIIFPSNLLHYVNPSKQERYTLSFNISTVFGF